MRADERLFDGRGLGRSVSCEAREMWKCGDARGLAVLCVVAAVTAMPFRPGHDFSPLRQPAKTAKSAHTLMNVNNEPQPSLQRRSFPKSGTGQRTREVTPEGIWRNFDAMLATAAERVLVADWTLFGEGGSNSLLQGNNRMFAGGMQEVNFLAVCIACIAWTNTLTWAIGTYHQRCQEITS